MTEYDLLQKNELKFCNIGLDGADLNQIAATVARVMDLEPSEVLVTDYLNSVMTLDVLRKSIYPHQLLGRKDDLLAAIGALPGVTITPKTTVQSEGMLGWISADREQAIAALANAESMATEIRSRLARRALVLSTGGEVLDGMIRDTNRLTLAEKLGAAGFKVAQGPTLRDDPELIAGTIRGAAMEEGYGLIVTTGGVGAEAKDCTVEAVLLVDSDAATPYICTFKKGHGRHVKDGVRIAVGKLGDALIVSLPGPNDEVCASMEPLLTGLLNGHPKAQLAEEIAAKLRAGLRDKMRDPHHHEQPQHH